MRCKTRLVFALGAVALLMSANLNAMQDDKEPKIPKTTTRGGEVGPESYDEALKWMRSDNQTNQLIAVRCLGLAEVYPKRQDEVAAQLEKMLNGRDRLVALHACRSLYVWATKKQTSSLVKALENTNSFVRKDAIQALGKLKDVSAAEAIANRLKADRFEREEAARALINLGPAVEKVVTPYRDDADSKVRDEAARILRQIGKAEKDEEFNSALKALKDKSPLAQNKGYKYFNTADADHPRRAEAAKLLASIWKDGERADRMKSTKAAIRWATREQVPVLHEMFKDKLTMTANRPAVVKTLTKFKDERSIPVLAEQLSDGFAVLEEQVYIDAFEAFGSAAEDAVLKNFDQETIPNRLFVCAVLQSIGTKKSLKPLLGLIDTAEKEKYQGHEAVIVAARQAMKKIEQRK